MTKKLAYLNTQEKFPLADSTPPRAASLRINLDRPLWTMEDVARALATTKEAVRKDVQRKRLPCIRLGPNRVRFVPDEIEAIIAKRRIEANA